MPLTNLIQLHSHVEFIKPVQTEDGTAIGAGAIAEVSLIDRDEQQRLILELTILKNKADARLEKRVIFLSDLEPIRVVLEGYTPHTATNKWTKEKSRAKHAWARLAGNGLRLPDGNLSKAICVHCGMYQTRRNKYTFCEYGH